MIAILIFVFSSSTWATETIVRVRSKQSVEDVSHGYFVTLLTMALDKTEQEYGKATVTIVEIDTSQRRILTCLEKGRLIDVAWVGTNRQREQRVRPVRIPLAGGLLGYRVPVIRKADIDRFKAIRTIEDLKPLRAIQGLHWPDSDIMEAAGLTVDRVAKFDLMYPILQHGRADYFPRGLNEVYSEVERTADDQLVALDALILAYPFPMYFFTKKENGRLAGRIEKGLRMAIADGSFLENMKTHPVTAPIFPLSKYKDALVLHIGNPYLPELTPLTDPSLWLRLD